MDPKYIIVQAGGRGSRMEALTRNKPKALVPVNNLPMVFHLFRRYPDRTFIVIGDHKFEVLEKYLRAFAEVDYKLVCASGHEGNCAGLREALSYIPEHERFMLIWCDLLLPENHVIPETKQNIVGISKDFPCRWMWKDGVFKEEPSKEHGVAGYFIFREKSEIGAVPESGEFVQWLGESGIAFEEQPLYGTREYGLYSEWEQLPKIRCRPFNRITVQNGRLIKEGIDEQGRKLGALEAAWYRKIESTSFRAAPAIYSYEPLTMELIDGKNVYAYTDMPAARKKLVLEKIIGCLKELHQLGSIPCDEDSYHDAYLAKTFRRLEKVRDLVPFAGDPAVTVNGRRCRNIFCCQAEAERLIRQYKPSRFVFLHGDCTFSNILLRNATEPVLIDPRGYFGNTKFYGDAAYDWVKLYYSLFSNYDTFNLKQFSLDIREHDVELKIASNGWEALEDDFFELLGSEVTRRQMKILLAVLWLSLTTYAWENYDSICGAFYNGLYYLEEALEMEEDNERTWR